VVRWYAGEVRKDLGLSQVDVDKLIETHTQNIDALERSAQVAAEEVLSIASKQREIVEAAFTEVFAIARDFKPMGNPQERIAKQAEFAKRAFNITVQNTQDIAELIRQSTTDATKIMRGRLKLSMDEVRSSIDRKD
jgi:phasin family protein